ncbi:MAG TPA: acyl-CoA dehydrogenase family protein [Pseudolysinimonas sp.]|jgi:acyl-CoA dehydrogenase|nr:acyl-CoA dehydrogenase family protein [Pseudolysinimonas sp.]
MSTQLIAQDLDLRAATAAEVAAAHADEVDVAARFPEEAMAALAEAGLLGASVPVELGGEGLSLAELAGVAAQLGAACSSTGMIFAMHHSQVLSLTRHLGGSPALAALATRIVREQLLLASATTEIGIGGDVRSSTCFVDRDGDRVHLVKNAPVISYGEQADLVLATARRDGDAAPGDQVLVACDSDALTLEPSGTWDTLGLRGTNSRGFLLTADTAAERVVPTPYEEISAETMLPVSHVLWAGVWLGMSRAAVETARRYVRSAARKSIGTTPPGATALVKLVAQLESLELLVTSAAREFDERADDRAALGQVGFMVSMNNLKVTASEAVAEIVAGALRITGISGFRNDGQYSVARLFRDAQGAALMVHNDRITAHTAQLILVQKGI